MIKTETDDDEILAAIASVVNGEGIASIKALILMAMAAEASEQHSPRDAVVSAMSGD